MDDYEYLVLLREALADLPDSPYHALLEVPDEFQERYAVDTDGEFILQRREAIGNALHELPGG